jgi:hypothetical protein
MIEEGKRKGLDMVETMKGDVDRWGGGGGR